MDRPRKTVMDRPKCVVCGEDQTDVIFLESTRILPEPRQFHIGFPVCDQHTLADLAPDQYVFDQLIVEVI